MKIFLGGTCGVSTWRNELFPVLDQEGIEYFNPVVDDWDDDAVKEENYQKALCDVHLYTITPLMHGAYSIAEAVESVMSGKFTIFNVLPKDQSKRFDEQQINSLLQIGKLIHRHGGIFISGSDKVVPALQYAELYNPEIKEKMGGVKTLKNSDASGAKKNVSDIEFFGNGDLFQLLCKAHSESEGWMKSTKAMDTPTGAVVQVTTQQRNPDGSYSIAEALTFVPGVKVIGPAGERKLA